MQNEKLLKKLEDGREYRTMQFSVRSDEGADSSMIVEGYAATFNQPYLLFEGRDYKVMEQIDPNAFKDCDMSDVIFQYDHTGRVFARTKNNTLTCSPDGTGFVTLTRTITKFKKLYDVSAVSLPANDATSISARNLSDGLIGEIRAERLKRANTIRRINLKLLGV